MSSPATMRLIGLLVIVGMVAGCGAREQAAPDDQAGGADDGLTLDEVEALRLECLSLAREARQVFPDNRAIVHGPPRSDQVPYCTTQVALLKLHELERAITDGNQDEAREIRDRVRAALDFVRDEVKRGSEGPEED